MNICYTAIFGNYDELKEPRQVTSGWRYLCYTDQPIKSKVWQIIQSGKNASANPQGAARYLKLNPHAVLGEHLRSIWVDGSFQINCNLNHWFLNFCKPPMTCINHPIRNCVYEEARAVIKNKRKGTGGLTEQIERYKTEGLPQHYGLIQSGIIMRWNVLPVVEFCKLWWEETMNSSMRDQISFAYTHWKNPIGNFIQYDYRTDKDFIFTKHKGR